MGAEGDTGITFGGRIAIGDPAPMFVLPDDTGRQWTPLDNDIAGRPLLLLFGEPGPSFAGVAAAFSAASSELARLGCATFVIARSAIDGASLPYLVDASGDTFAAYGVVEPKRATAVLIGPNGRIAQVSDVVQPAAADAVLGTIRRMASLHWADMLAVHPPVLLVPMALGPAECAGLVRVWRDLDARHGSVGHSEVRPECVTFVREYGRVQQYHIDDPRLLAAVDAKLAPRIMPEIAKAFDARVANREALVLSRYDSAESGMLRPHRDCMTAETAHRRFSLSVALNEDFAGGEIQFREYSDRLYRLPIGTALIFSCALMHEVLPVTEGSRFVLVTHLW